MPYLPLPEYRSPFIATNYFDMKNLFTILFAFGLVGLASAQSFSLEPNVVEIASSPDSTDVIAHNDIVNHAPFSKNIRWTRTILCINPDTACVQVCDLNLCYLCHISSKVFTLGPSATGLITVHYIKDLGISGSAIVKLDFVNTANSSDSTSATYIFNSCVPAGTESPLPEATVKVFPNPTTDFFALEEADAVAQVHLYAADGRQLESWTATPGTHYSLATFPAGLYYVVLQDGQGRLFQATTIRKQ